MRLVDTHCHLQVEEFGADRDAVMDRALKAGVSDFVVPSIARADMPAVLNLCAGRRHLHAALGLHPVYLESHFDADLGVLERLAADQPLVAIGEIGLDFMLPELDPKRQQRLFEAQLAIARDARLPVLLHVRKAHDQVLSTLRRFNGLRGVAHAFNGSAQQAEQYIQMGFVLGFGGVVTFDRARKIRALATTLPLQSMVLETDAPDLPPADHYGERNSPEYLPEVLTVIAQLREMETAEVATQTTRNACELFGWPVE